MAYMSLIAECLICDRIFSSNPDYVPSLHNQPVCESCMRAINARRAAMGRDALFVHPLAYTIASDSDDLYPLD